MFDAGGIVELAGFMFDAGGAIAGVVVVIGVFAGTTVTLLAGMTTLAFAGLTFTLVEVSPPHAMPRALYPRTVESTITFVILIKNSYLSQRIIFLFPGVRLIRHNRFALNSFLFKANVNIVIGETIVNLKIIKK